MFVGIINISDNYRIYRIIPYVACHMHNIVNIVHMINENFKDIFTLNLGQFIF